MMVRKQKVQRVTAVLKQSSIVSTKDILRHAVNIFENTCLRHTPSYVKMFNESLHNETDFNAQLTKICKFSQ